MSTATQLISPEPDTIDTPRRRVSGHLSHTTQALGDVLARGEAHWPTATGPGAIFQSYDWWQTWWDVASAKAQRSARAIVVEVGNQTVIVPTKSALERGVPQLTWADDDFGCPDFRTLGCATMARAVATELASQNRFRLLFDNLRQPSAQHVADALSQLGWAAVVEQSHLAPSIPLAESFDAYLLARFSGKSRSQLRRRLRDATKNGNHVIDHHADGSIAEGMAHLVRLHGKRWDHGGVFGDPTVLRFHTLLTQRLAQRGLLRLSTLVMGGKPIAAYYGYADGETAAFYQSGRDTESDASGGSVLIAHAIRSAIDDGCTRFDLLRGAETYKARWKPEPTTTWKVRAYAPGVRGQLSHGVVVAEALARQLIKRARK
jgi:CelD/BcsL family acetyltransferase involved in cellulose biosynthesis